MASAARDIPSAMKDLKISTNPKQSSKPKPKKPDVADSWEDELDETATPTDPSTADDSGTASPSGLSELSRQSTNFNPHPPPPTPASPTQGAFSYPDLASPTRFPGLAKTTSTNVPQPGSTTPNRSRTHSTANSGTSTPPDKRPDKTTSTATRLIAAGLGMKVPKRTEAEREYDRVSRENEKKKREREREEAKRNEEEVQKAKEAVWEN